LDGGRGGGGRDGLCGTGVGVGAADRRPLVRQVQAAQRGAARAAKFHQGLDALAALHQLVARLQRTRI